MKYGSERYLWNFTPVSTSNDRRIDHRFTGASPIGLHTLDLPPCWLVLRDLCACDSSSTGSNPCPP